MCHGDIREGARHKFKDILDKSLKRRHQFHSVFDDTTLSWAKEALRLIIHQRGLTAQLTRPSPAVYDFPKAWLELTASKEPCQQPQQPLRMKAEGTGGLNDVVKDTSSPFWSTVRWAALDTSRSMRALTLCLKDDLLQNMASPPHIKKNRRPEVGIQQGSSSNGNIQRRRSADVQVMAEAKTVLGKRHRTSHI